MQDSPNIKKAANKLSDFVEHEARKTAIEVGFAWLPMEYAPDTYDELGEAYTVSKTTNAPLPVSSLYCDTTIFGRTSTNLAMRFWHDVTHMRTGLNFSLPDELELGLHHLKLAEAGGIIRNSLPWRLLRTDLLGQNYLLGIANRFPINQARFVSDCLEHGLDEGVLMESRRTE